MVPFFDPTFMHGTQRAAIEAALRRVLDSGCFILGSEVSDFEAKAAEFLQLPCAIGTSSGTDALYCTLLALGIGMGDEVITSPFTFVATGEVILRTGATPVFVDIDPQSYCLDPNRVEQAITPATRAVLAVHLFGWPDKVEELDALCRVRNLWLVEDACQAFGARAGGRAAGGFGIAGCFSFFPTKPLGGLGDGGLVVSGDSILAERVRSLRSHGIGRDGSYANLGGNFRLDAMQAACLSAKLPEVRRGIEARARLSARYKDLLASHPDLQLPPSLPAHVESAHATFTLRVPRGRNQLLSHLKARNVGCTVYYPSLVPEHPIFTGRARLGELGHAREARDQVLSLPCFWGLTSDQQEEVCHTLLTWSP